MLGDYRSVPVPGAYYAWNITAQAAWRDGVDAALASRQDIPSDTGALKITGWTREAVRAFAHVSEDDPDTARRIVRGMSGADRAVLSFWAAEVSRLVEEEDSFRRQADRTRARDSHPDTAQL